MAATRLAHHASVSQFGATQPVPLMFGLCSALTCCWCTHCACSGIPQAASNKRLCMHVYLQGYVVVAPEHADGTASTARLAKPGVGAGEPGVTKSGWRYYAGTCSCSSTVQKVHKYSRQIPTRQLVCMYQAQPPPHDALLHWQQSSTVRSYFHERTCVMYCLYGLQCLTQAWAVGRVRQQRVLLSGE
jgi:hypothetical protein